MKRKHSLIGVIIILLFLFSGCSIFQLQQASEELNAQIIALKVAMDENRSLWVIAVTFLKEAYSDELGSKYMDYLDALDKIMSKEGLLTDKEIGKALALVKKLSTPVIQTIIKDASRELAAFPMLLSLLGV